MKKYSVKLQNKNKSVSKKDLEALAKKLKAKDLANKIVKDSKVKKKFPKIKLEHSGSVYRIWLNGKSKVSEEEQNPNEPNNLEEVNEEGEFAAKISITVKGFEIQGENEAEVRTLVGLLPAIIRQFIVGTLVLGGIGLAGYAIYLEINRRNHPPREAGDNNQ